MRYLLLLALLLTPSLSWGGMAAKRMAAVMPTCRAQTGTVNSTNGAIDIDTGEDTGTGTPSALPLCSGTASVSATCQGGTGTGNVYLVINGATAASLNCASGENRNNTLSAPVGGIYTVRVYSTATGTGFATANTFSFPVAQ